MGTSGPQFRRDMRKLGRARSRKPEHRLKEEAERARLSQHGKEKAEGNLAAHMEREIFNPSSSQNFSKLSQADRTSLTQCWE